MLEAKAGGPPLLAPVTHRHPEANARSDSSPQTLGFSFQVEEVYQKVPKYHNVTVRGLR